MVAYLSLLTLTLCCVWFAQRHVLRPSPDVVFASQHMKSLNLWDTRTNRYTTPLNETSGPDSRGVVVNACPFSRCFVSDLTFVTCFVQHRCPISHLLFLCLFFLFAACPFHLVLVVVKRSLPMAMWLLFAVRH